MDERARLAGAGARYDQEGGVAECDGACLVRVERRGEPLFVGGGEIPLAGAVEAWLVGHGAHI